MNPLHKYINIVARMSVSAIATKTRHGYFTVQKNLTGVRQNREVQEEIASAVGLTFEQAWGPTSEKFLYGKIRIEFARRAAEAFKKVTGNKSRRRVLVDSKLNIAKEVSVVNG